MTAAIGTDMVSYFIALSDEQHRKNTAKQRETQHSWPDQVHEEKCQFSGLAGCLLKVLKACGSCVAV